MNYNDKKIDFAVWSLTISWTSINQNIKESKERLYGRDISLDGDDF